MGFQDVFFHTANPLGANGDSHIADLVSNGPQFMGGVVSLVGSGVANAVVPFNPTDKKIIVISAVVKPPAPHNPLEAMFLSLIRWPANPANIGAIEEVASGSSDSTDQIQEILVSGISHQVDPNFVYALKLNFGDAVGAFGFFGSITYHGRG